MDYLRRSEAAKLATQKTIVGFGAGGLGVQTQQLLDGVIAFFVDNEPIKWETKLEDGVPVRAPSVLKNIDPNSFAVIVCSEHYEEINKQLNTINEKIQTFITPLLRDHEVFNRLLDCSKKLLVSAYGVGGGLYLVNGSTEEHLLLKKGSFRGLLRIDDRLFVATERGEIHEIISLNPLETVVCYKAEELTQMHGLAFWEEEDLLIAGEAQFDRITFLKKSDFRLVDRISLGRKGLKPDMYNGHVNDLFVEGNRLFASMISYSNLRKSGMYDGCIIEIDLPSREVLGPVMHDLLFPHSIKIVGKNFYVLESLTGRFVNGKKRTVARLPGFIRGLYINNNLAYIGQSRNRMLNEATGYIPTLSMDSGIYVLDLQSSLYRFIKMPEMCDVYDIIDLDV